MTRNPQSFRLPADLYAQAKAVAAARNETLTHVITEALRRYVKRNQPPRSSPVLDEQFRRALDQFN